jgi:hypothetical protein
MALKMLYLHSVYDKLDIEAMIKDQGILPRDLPSKVVSIGYEIKPIDATKFKIVGQVARCCWKDPFNKKIARAIINGRYEKRGPAFEIPWADNFSIEELLQSEFHPDYGAAWD